MQGWGHSRHYSTWRLNTQSEKSLLIPKVHCSLSQHKWLMTSISYRAPFLKPKKLVKNNHLGSLWGWRMANQVEQILVWGIRGFSVNEWKLAFLTISPLPSIAKILHACDIVVEYEYVASPVFNERIYQVQNATAVSIGNWVFRFYGSCLYSMGSKRYWILLSSTA